MRPFDGVLRTGARRLIEAAVTAEFEEYLSAFVQEQVPDGRQRVVRNGHLPERKILTGLGEVGVRVPKARSRSGSPEPFRSSVVPPYVRRCASLDAAIPWLYPRCIGGASACPPVDCGGPDAYHTRRDEATGLDAMNDLALVADAVERVLIHKDSSCLDEDGTRWRLERAVERLGDHARFLETAFLRGAVNRGFRAGDHRRLMHQQIC